MEFVKIGIVGPPPGRGGVETRFYAAGPALDNRFLDGGELITNVSVQTAARLPQSKCVRGSDQRDDDSVHRRSDHRLLVSAMCFITIAASQPFHWELMNRRVLFYPWMRAAGPAKWTNFRNVRQCGDDG